MTIEEFISNNPIRSDEGLRPYFSRIAPLLDTNANAVRQRVDRLLKKLGYSGVSRKNFDDCFASIVVDSGGKVPDGRKTVDISEDKMAINYTGDTSITSLEAAIDFFQIDTKEWRPIRIRYNSWPTSAKNNDGEFMTVMNYQVRVDCEPRFTKDQKEALAWKECVDKLTDSIKKYTGPITVSKGSGVGILTIADFHFGASNKGLTVNKDYDIEVFFEHMNVVVDSINKKGYEHVDLNILGDLVESWSGLNHMDSWKYLGQHGSMAFISLCEWFSENVIAKINNLRSINMVNGNHDRTSMDSKVDTDGEVGTLFAYVLKLKFGDRFKYRHHPLILSFRHEGTNLNSIIFHGHKLNKLSNISNLVIKYGAHDCFNIIQRGHLHTRASYKPFDTILKDSIGIDELSYRMIGVSSICHPGHFAESIGASSLPGFAVIESNGRGAINHLDCAL